MTIDDFTVLEVIVLVVVPAVVGIVLAQAIGDLAKRRGRAPPVVRGLRILISAIWIAIVTVDVSLIFGPFGFLSTLTASAIVGIGVSLALQTTLQNFIAGFMLLRHRFLRVGDVVQISGVKGTVVSFGLISVILRLEGGALATVSNSNLLAGPTINLSATTRLAGEY